MRVDEAVFELKQIRDVYANMRKEYKSCVEALDTAINALETQKWIPCSERLPENSEEVLTTYIVNGNKNKRYTETATYYDGDDGFWSSPWDEYRVAGTRIKVIAWKYLPEPFKGELR